MKNDKKLTLTIVIPVYNEENYLTRCLDAIAGQVLMPDEVIVVDNNSSDKTAQIATSYSFVRLLKEPKQGVVFARNQGFNAAKSDIIARIDGDTILPRDWVKKAKTVYRRAGLPTFFALTAPSRFRNRFNPFWYAMHRLTYFWPSRLLLGHTTFVGSNMFITRQLWQAVKQDTCVHTNMHEDMDLALHVAQTGTPINFYPDMKASILARRMVTRSFYYPLMMWRVKNRHHLS